MDSDQIQKVDSLFGHNTHNKSMFASDTGLTINQAFTVENTKKSNMCLSNKYSMC